MPRWPSSDELPETRVCKKCNQEKLVVDFLYMNGFTCKQCSKEYKAQHYQENKDRYSVSNAEWARNHPEEMKGYIKKWVENNPEKVAQHQLNYQRANPEKVSENNRKRNSLRRGAVSQTPYTRQELWERDGGMCYWCGLPAEFSFSSRSNKAYFTVDHVIPLVRGGSDDLGNVVVAHLSCNQSHNNRLVSELPEGWAEERRKIMEPLIKENNGKCRLLALDR